MIIDLALIGEEGQSFDGEESPDILDLGRERSVRFRGPIHCEVMAHLVSGSLIVQGRVRVEVDRECSRCGEFFSTTVQDSSFLRDYAITPDQLQVDIAEEIREAVMLHMTLFPQCSGDCKGVCVHCGMNLNFGTCSCEVREPGGAWGALDQLNLNE